MEYGIDFLREKLSHKAERVDLRYKYYEMKNNMRKINALIPPEFMTLTYSLGWCAKAVDSIADRMIFDKFERDDFLLNEIYSQNNADILFDSSILSALIASCSFLCIGKGADGYPTIECIDGGDATGIIDPVTHLLTEGYAVLERGENSLPALEAYFILRKRRQGTCGNHEAPCSLTSAGAAYKPSGCTQTLRAQQDKPFLHGYHTECTAHIAENRGGC